MSKPTSKRELTCNKELIAHLGARSLVMVGLMGCGKTAVGRRVAARLELPFVDADDEIEKAADQTISEIFADHGEAYFRDGERRVIKRLLGDGPQVLATGGGAYMNDETRHLIAETGISIWLKADLPVLVRRVGRRERRPLLRNGNPEDTLRRLMNERYPVYAEADITIESRDGPHEEVVAEVIRQLMRYLSKSEDTLDG